DFGLAGLAGAFAGDEIRAGTPAYMAPEQRAGRAVSRQSDLYALGLVLYEMFTGRHPFGVPSAAGQGLPQEDQTPVIPSSVLQGVDPSVERVILRCLQEDPRDRPASARAVLVTLPGGD